LVNQYCVVLCGLQAGATDDASAWRPVAAALKLDQDDFARRVVAALPRVVRRELDQTTAERVAQLLQAMHVDARALPDDRQLAYIDRAGTTRGPLPQSSLDEFIQPGESYRLRGDTTWSPWPVPVDHAATATATIDHENIDETTPSSTPDDGDINDTPARSPTDSAHGDGGSVPDELSDDAYGEPPHATSTSWSPDTWNDLDDTAAEPLAAATRDEASHATPPPVPAPAPPDDPETAAPTVDSGEAGHDGSLIDPPQETPASDDPESFAPMAPEAVEAGTPAPSRAGRLVVLLVLAGLAAWAYFHWIAGTHVSGLPAVPAAIRPSKSSSGQPATPTPSASAAKAASTTHPAAAASAVATPASTTATPPATASLPAPATTNAETAVATSSSSPAPAAAGTSTTVPALPSPATTTSSARPATPTH
jgi:hypothetical protein